MCAFHKTSVISSDTPFWGLKGHSSGDKPTQGWYRS